MDEFRRAIRPNTKLIALAHASNVTGTLQPLREIGQIAREHGIPLLVDAAQSAGHVPIDVRADFIDLLAAHPDLAVNLFNAFADAKRPYAQRLASHSIENPSKDDGVFQKVMEMTGDPLPYGIAPNRGVLEAVIRHAVTQGIIARAVEVEDLFPPSTHDLTA